MPLKHLLKRDLALSAIFYLLVALALLTRIQVFFTVNIHHVDSDQPPMWLGASHYAQGLFYEPRFYGQDYNTFMEGLFAVPFMKCGLPVYYAVPLATHLIFLTPFLFTAFYLFFKKRREQAIIVISVLLCFSTGFDILTAIPRGFVTGLFFCSFFVLSLLNPNNLRFVLLNTLMAYAGYLVNPNSVLVSAPFLFYLFLKNFRSRRYYLFSLGGLLAAAPLDYLLNHFYKVHPDYISYGLNNRFAFTYFVKNISELDKRFCHASLFVEDKSFVMLLLFAGMGIIAFLRNRALFYSFLVFIAVMLLSFFAGKVTDGVTWPWYSFSRMYIGFPLFIVLFACLLPARPGRYIYAVALVALGFTGFKLLNYDKALAKHTDPKNQAFVHLFPLNQILELTEGYKGLCIRLGINTFVIEDGVWCAEYLACGGPAIFNDFPNTFKTRGDRMHGRMLKEENVVHPEFIAMMNDYNFDQYAKAHCPQFSIDRIDDFGLFRIYNNRMTTGNFCRMVNAR